MVLLRGCNAGLVGYDQSMAMKFCEKISSTGRVVASDGYSYASIVGLSKSYMDDEAKFHAVLTEYSVDKRDAIGWVAFYWDESKRQYRTANLIQSNDLKKIYYEVVRLYKYSSHYSQNTKRKVDEPLFAPFN